MVWGMRVGVEFAELFEDRQLSNDCKAAEKKLVKAASKVYKKFLASCPAPDAARLQASDCINDDYRIN